jgi:RNA polymerase sigma-70 factor (ECF subfamily)
VDEQRRQLLGALAEIPEPQRAVLRLAYFDGLSQTEIAARLEKPLGTVKSLARLGLDKLRARLRSVPRRRGGRR